MSKLSNLGFLAFAAGFLAPSASAQSLPPLLQKAFNRSATLRYVGERSVSFRRDGKPMQAREIVTRDGPRTRIDYPEGTRQAGQIVVEEGDHRRQYIPGKNEIRILPARREESLERLQKFIRMVRDSGGSITETTGERVAGLDTGQVVFKDGYGNVMQRLFIDPKSGAVLKRAVYDPGGAPVGSMVFTRIAFGGKCDPAIFRLNRKGARVITALDELKDLIAKGGFANVRLPQGELLMARVLPTPGAPTLLQVYSINGERVSLFQTSGDLDANRLRRFKGNDLRTRAWRDEGRNFALIGALNDKALDRFVAVLRDRP